MNPLKNEYAIHSENALGKGPKVVDGQYSFPEISSIYTIVGSGTVWWEVRA